MSVFRLRLLFVSVLAVLLSACSSDHDHGSQPPLAARTVAIYLLADNSLEYSMSRDLREMCEGAQSLRKGERLVVFLDNSTETAIYVLDNTTKANPKPAFIYSENQNSSDPQTLAQFLAWVRTHAPAQEYGLIMGSHADGWLPPAVHKARTIGIDDGQGAYKEDKGPNLEIEDIARVLESSGMHFAYIFFDACHMQCLEVDYALRRSADHIIAAPDVIPGDGADYRHMVPQALFEQPDSIARVYMRDVQNMTASTYSVGLVISVIETAKLDSLARLTRRLLTTSLVAEPGVYPKLYDILQYGSYSYYLYYRPSYFDAAAAMRRILTPEAGDEWAACLDYCTVYKAGTPVFSTIVSEHELTPDFTGVSIFLPQKAYDENSEACVYGNHNLTWKQTSWYADAGFDVLGF